VSRASRRDAGRAPRGRTPFRPPVRNAPGAGAGSLRRMDRRRADAAELLLTGALLSLYAGLRGSAWAVGALERAVMPVRPRD